VTKGRPAPLRHLRKPHRRDPHENAVLGSCRSDSTLLLQNPDITQWGFEFAMAEILDRCSQRNVLKIADNAGGKSLQ